MNGALAIRRLGICWGRRSSPRTLWLLFACQMVEPDSLPVLSVFIDSDTAWDILTAEALNVPASHI